MSIKETFYIDEIDYQSAMEIVIKNHYLHRKCPCSHAFGLFRISDNTLMGVVVYGIGPSSTLLRGIAGDKYSHDIYELTRLWVDDSCPKNCESYLIGNTIKLLDKHIIVSFADSSRGHVGYVYQASNFMYCGLSSKFKDPVVCGMENKHHASFAKGMTISELKAKYGDNIKWVDRPRKHRYIYINAAGKTKLDIVRSIKYRILPYPKNNNDV